MQINVRIAGYVDERGQTGCSNGFACLRWIQIRGVEQALRVLGKIRAHPNHLPRRKQFLVAPITHVIPTNKAKGLTRAGVDLGLRGRVAGVIWLPFFVRIGVCHVITFVVGVSVRWANKAECAIIIINL